MFKDTSKKIITQNNSPDIPVTYSINAYRGCEHGCAHCYARPTHEYLGHAAGLDFESKIYVKEEARISIVGLLSTLAAGYFGGSLVQDYRVGVQEPFATRRSSPIQPRSSMT